MKLFKKTYEFLSIFSLGFYSYFVNFFKFIKKLRKKESKKLDKIINHYKKRQQQPQYLILLCIYVVCGTTIFDMVYKTPSQKVDNTKYLGNISVTQKEEEQEIESGNVVSTQKDNDLFRKYSSLSLDEVNITNLKSNVNEDIVGWISVDSTSINYPFVQTQDNEYYLNHNINKSYTTAGWVFEDYRNEGIGVDQNTIIYGHNLLNNTSFGSIPSMLKAKYLNNSNKTIIILTENNKYVFKVFSIYQIKTETYYLQTNFSSDSEYLNFLNTLKSRSQVELNESVDENDKILTLSTCSYDNQGRIVVHAKLVG